ncbi:hypothetical protein D7D52_35530 [Nocardia yunnanensis]|uniref:Uncharacterized protein n=1 Tax=Nocardia yunnanensis TaxID=2382165 RepID=A0A386ZM64_9NOCA|nr:hypothetical protein [Nocardia yunnanensis]AYF78264.1 hypothetical protein D7D52_35530 [Nocardia yunnanensis]
MLNAFGEFANGSVPPRSRIYRNAQPNLIDAWLLELLRGARIGDRFYLRTGLEYFPWADCRVLDHRWLESLRRVIGTNQGYIAHDKNSAVMTIGTQYEVLGFVAGSGLPAAAPGSAPAPGVAPASGAAVGTGPAVGTGITPAEDIATRRIVRSPAAAEPSNAVLSGDLRARRLAALTSDPSADRDNPVDAAAASNPVSDPPATPVAEVPASQPHPVESGTSVESEAADREASASPRPIEATPAAEPVAHVDEAPTQLLTRIVVPTED